MYAPRKPYTAHQASNIIPQPWEVILRRLRDRQPCFSSLESGVPYARTHCHRKFSSYTSKCTRCSLISVTTTAHSVRTGEYTCTQNQIRERGLYLPRSLAALMSVTIASPITRQRRLPHWRIPPTASMPPAPYHLFGVHFASLRHLLQLVRHLTRVYFLSR